MRPQWRSTKDAVSACPQHGLLRACKSCGNVRKDSSKIALCPSPAYFFLDPGLYLQPVPPTSVTGLQSTLPTFEDVLLQHISAFLASMPSLDPTPFVVCASMVLAQEFDRVCYAITSDHVCWIRNARMYGIRWAWSRSGWYMIIPLRLVRGVGIPDHNREALVCGSSFVLQRRRHRVAMISRLRMSDVFWLKQPPLWVAVYELSCAL